MGDIILACIITFVLTTIICIILAFAANNEEDRNRIIHCAKNTDLSIESCESIVLDNYKSK